MNQAPEKVDAGSEYDKRWEPEGLAALEAGVEREQDDKMMVEKGQIKVILRRMDAMESRISDLEDQVTIIQNEVADEDEIPEVDTGEESESDADETAPAA